MTTEAEPRDLTGALVRLRDELAGVQLELELPDAGSARQTRDELVGQIEDYLLPRVRQMDAPLLMVVGGSTGAGKSTLVNSLVGSSVSPAGVLRPTTRAPVLVCNPADVHWFDDSRVLPGLARTTGGAGAPGGLELTPTPALPAGLALLDSPDIDSVVASNRALAGQLLAAADSWLFVTTAARYADAVPWDLLHAARDRGTALSLVLNRVPPEAAGEVADHLRQMLADRGLGETQLLVVPETVLADGLLPAEALAPVREWLDGLSADAQARAALVGRTLTGALDSLPPRVAVVRRALEHSLGAVEELHDAVEDVYAAALAEVDETVRSGSLLRGEVLGRWHEVVGTGDLMRALETRVGWLRDRVRALVTGTPPADVELKTAVETSIDAVVHAAADRAAERAAERWSEQSAGRALLTRAPRLDAASPQLLEETADEVRAWQGFIFELVREEGASKRTTARLASLGVNGAGLTVMLAVFVQTGGLTGAEIAVAGGTSALGQRVLEAIFGDQAVRTLAARARDDLLARVERLLARDAARFTDLLTPLAPSAESPERLSRALRELERAR
ncbi:MAG: ABC transporter [Actinobacteria bacterium]|nr:ABC transporter [Actinomycetota bacterium]